MQNYVNKRLSAYGFVQMIYGFVQHLFPNCSNVYSKQSINPNLYKSTFFLNKTTNVFGLLFAFLQTLAKFICKFEKYCLSLLP